MTQEECLKIKKVENGFIVTEIYCSDINEDGKPIMTESIEVIEEETSFNNEKETLKRLLELVAEKMGCMEDSYGKENLSITFDRKGRKCSDDK